MTQFLVISRTIAPVLLLGSVGLSTIVPTPSLAQTSPTTTFENQNNTVDLFDGNSSREFNPLDLIHQANFSRQDPRLFFEKQQENLSSEALDFRNRQLEQLRQQGYQTQGLGAIVVPATPESETSEPGLSIETQPNGEPIILDLTPEIQTPEIKIPGTPTLETIQP